jgi:hypothetical protein
MGRWGSCSIGYLPFFNFRWSPVETLWNAGRRDVCTLCKGTECSRGLEENKAGVFPVGALYALGIGMRLVCSEKPGILPGG